MSLIRYRIRCVALAVLMVLHSQAAAWAVDVPRSVDASEANRRMQTLATPSEPLPESKTQKALVEAPKNAEAVHFHLTEIRVEGNNAYSKDALLPLYQEFLNKDVSLRDVYVVVSRIQQRYLDDGYVLAMAFLPPQEISAGKVLIRVAEGYIANVRWVGEPLDSKLAQELVRKISSMRPFNGKKLEEMMLRLNELPSVQAKSIIAPYQEKDAKDGAVELQISVERKRVDASLGVNSYASRHLGVWQENARLAVYDVLADLDQLSMTGVASMNPHYSHYVRGEYSLPVHTSGTILRIGGAVSHSAPGFTLAPNHVRSSARNMWFGVSQPVLRSRERSLTLDAQFNMNTQQTDLLYAPFYEDRIRSLTVSSTYAHSDRWAGSNLITLGIAQGLDILDSTKTGSNNLSRARGHSDFTKITLDASRLQLLNDSFNLLLAGTAQTSNAALLSSEQFGFGGIAFGRAYDSSELTGDSGIAASVELQYRSVGVWGDVSIQPFMFYDIGKVWNRGAGGEVSAAASAGGGFRIQFASYAKMDVNIAQPLTRIPSFPKLGAEGKDPRISTSLSLLY